MQLKKIEFCINEYIYIYKYEFFVFDYFQAKRLRKTLGGGMRQVGVLCAAALVALRENVKKLEDDHRKAKILAGVVYFLRLSKFSA